MPVPLAIAATRIGVQLLSTPKGRAIAGGVALVVAAGALVPMGIGVAMVSSIVSSNANASVVGQAGDCLADPSSTATPDPSASATPTDLEKAYTAEQINNAKIILGVIKSVALPANVDTEANRQRAGVDALSAALQESSLRNLNYGDADSQGLFQMRPSMGWGTPEQITTPTYAAAAFILGVQSAHIHGLVDIADWPSVPVGTVDQTVEASLYPDLYAPHEAVATQMVDAWWADAPAQPVPAELVRTDYSSAGTVTINGSGSTACNSTYTPATGPVVLGEWGNPPYPNGEIPISAMCIIPWATTYYLRCDAVQGLVALNEKWKADHGGANLVINDAYRSYDRQVYEKNLWTSLGCSGCAAPPGQSNHGWGLAVDLGGMGSTLGDFSGAGYAWMKANGPAFGFSHPSHMEPGGTGPFEPWHFEYTGVAGTTPAAS